MSSRSENVSESTIQYLVEQLDSLVDGERAATALAGMGQAAVPHLSRFLLMGPPRTIALPRCRAVRVLGELGACAVLISYFRDVPLPSDPVVLFAEDEVRSAVARELLGWKTDETFFTLLEATKNRATGGLVSALGEFMRVESVPILFSLLEDDLCREEAMTALRKLPEATRNFGTLLLRGQTNISVHGAGALRRRRATLQLLAECGPSSDQWNDLLSLLGDADTEVVIVVAGIGIQVAPAEQRRQIFEALFRVSKGANWAQEYRIESLLDTDRRLAASVATAIAERHAVNHEAPDWLDPSWRVLKYALDDAAPARRIGSPD